MESNLKDKNINNYFIDVTYKIVPKSQEKCKLLTISGFNWNKNIIYYYELILKK